MYRYRASFDDDPGLASGLRAQDEDSFYLIPSAERRDGSASSRGTHGG
jgi:hypothetical protein